MVEAGAGADGGQRGGQGPTRCDGTCDTGAEAGSQKADEDDRSSAESVGGHPSRQGAQAKEQVATETPGKYHLQRNAGLGREAYGQCWKDQFHVVGGGMGKAGEVYDASLVRVEDRGCSADSHFGQVADTMLFDKGSE